MATRQLPNKVRKVLYTAWSLRNQFNGEWDSYYFPELAKALDALIPPDCEYPKKLTPSNRSIK